MNNGRKVAWIFGLVMMSGLGWVAPAVANPPNQSTITGTNVFYSIAPDFFERYGSLDPAILEEAQRLANALDDAYARCIESAHDTYQPRRFALGHDPHEICSSCDCEELNALLLDAQSFLSEVYAQVEELNRTISDRPW